MEIKEKVDSLAKAWEEFKATNDARLKEIEKKGSADALLVEKIEKISSHLDEQKAKIEAVEKAALRPAASDAKGEKSEYEKKFSDYVRGKVSDLEMKALSVGTDVDGGFLVTPQMSATINKVIFESSPVRQFASVETVSTSELEMIDDANDMGAGWTGETTAITETTTAQVGKKIIPTQEIYAEPRATQKLLDDSFLNVEAWLNEKIADRFARFENTAFVSGSGVAQPRGFLTYANGTSWGQIEQVASGTSATFSADNLIALFYTLKEGYMANAAWMMNRQSVRIARQLKGGDGQYLWQPALSAGQPDLLMGRPVAMAADMPVPAASSLSVAVGDFRRGYMVVDRRGITILRDPFTAKPFVKFYTTKRVGGDVVNFEAIKLLRLGA